MHSVETRASWVVAWTALAAMSVSYGAPLIVVVALKPIAATLGNAARAPGAGHRAGLVRHRGGRHRHGRFADRIGVRWTVLVGALMIAIGLVVAAAAPPGRCCSATACSSGCWASPGSTRRC